MRLAADRARVTVPATSANLGPGFDALGIALAVRDEITVRAVAGAVNVTVAGHGADVVPTDANHLVARATLRALEHVGAPLTGLELHCHNRIPHGRGLGSSAAAVVAGIMARSEERRVGRESAIREAASQRQQRRNLDLSRP